MLDSRLHRIDSFGYTALMNSRSIVMLFGVCFVTLTTVACAPKPIVKTGGSAPAAVANRKTFSFGTVEARMNGFVEGEATAEVVERAKAEVSTELRAKGYVEAKTGEGELVVYVAAGTRKVLEDRSPAAMRNGASQTTSVERGIAVDIMEKGSTTPLFHGDARYDADLKVVDEAKVRAAVTELLVPLAASAR